MKFSASFPASLDKTTKIISGGVCLFLLAVIFAVHVFPVVLLSLLTILLSLACSPRGYEIDGRCVLVGRLVGTVRIPLDGLREARKAAPGDFRGCIRLWGSGGLFGYYGLFTTSKLGKSTWYVTNRSNGIVLVTAAKTVLLSPDDPGGFLAAILAAAPVPASYPAPAFHRPSRSSASSAKLIGVSGVAAAIALWAFVFTYSPGVPGYTLTPDQLTIHDRFFPVTLPASSVDVNQIRIVDLTREAQWRPIARTNGFAVPHYRSGWFRVASGQKVRLYRADGQRVVLLPPLGDGAPVLYQAADPDLFVRQIRALWSMAPILADTADPVQTARMGRGSRA